MPLKVSKVTRMSGSLICSAPFSTVHLIILVATTLLIFAAGQDQVLTEEGFSFGGIVSGNVKTATNSSADIGKLRKLLGSLRARFKSIRNVPASDGNQNPSNSCSSWPVYKKYFEKYKTCDPHELKQKILEDELEKLNLGKDVMQLSESIVDRVDQLVQEYPKFERQKEFTSRAIRLYELLRDGPSTRPAVYSIQVKVSLKPISFISEEDRKMLEEDRARRRLGQTDVMEVEEADTKERSVTESETEDDQEKFDDEETDAKVKPKGKDPPEKSHGSSFYVYITIWVITGIILVTVSCWVAKMVAKHLRTVCIMCAHASTRQRSASATTSSNAVPLAPLNSSN